MGKFDKLKNMLNVSDEDYEDDDIEEEEEEEERSSGTRKHSFFASEEYGNFEETPKPKYKRSSYSSNISSASSNKVVDIHTTAKLQVVLTKPTKFTDAREIADDLNDKRTVVVNLEATPKEEAIRLLDFLTGVAYANDGEIKKIAKSTFIITPYNVDVSGDLLYELESNGVFFI